MKLEDADQSYLGSCQKVVINEDETIMMHGDGNKDKVEARIQQIKDRIPLTESLYD